MGEAVCDVYDASAIALIQFMQKLIAVDQAQDQFTGFTGIELRNRAQGVPTTVPALPAKPSAQARSSTAPPRPMVQTGSLPLPKPVGNKLPTPPITPPKLLVPGGGGGRAGNDADNFSPVTEIYEDYLARPAVGGRLGRAPEPVPPVPPLPTDLERVGAWAKTVDTGAKNDGATASPAPLDSYPPTTYAPTMYESTTYEPTTYEPSAYGDVSRSTVRRGTRKAMSARAPSSYYGDFEEGMEIVSIRIKVSKRLRCDRCLTSTDTS
jgi:hypothetical protein